MFRLAIIILVYLRSGQTMTLLTKHLLTPLYGEACGYRSCHPTVQGVLNVHIVPHTHAELGSTKTFDNHFTGRDEFYDKSNINMKRILDYVISELWADNERRFAFSDLPYLYKWWSIRDGTVKRMVYQLIRQGRLQIIGGGWSMTDESTATYQAIIDHFTYTLRKLNATFLDCARPTVTWQSDVLGHTNEFASLMAQMGFDGHFINPISLDDELERMRSKRLEFIWQGSPDLGASSEIFTHKLFDGYWTPPGFCFGGQCGDPLIVDSNTAYNNVEERVKLFIEAMLYRQGPHYASKHLMVMMGQRFGYYDAPLWFQNIDKLIRNVNNYVGSKDKNMILYYSTPACYLRAVYESNTTFPVERDDFVPIAYDKNTHFSGIFTSRPTVKYAARVGNVLLQITKQLQVLARLANNEKFFEDFHWIMGALQDHTILSGAMRPFVRDYYVDKIYKTLQLSDIIIRDGLKNLMRTPKMAYKRCLFNISYCEYTNRDNYHIVIYNPLAWNVTVPVRLPVNEGRYTVYQPNLKKVQSVIMKIPLSIQAIPYKRNETYDYELVFLAEDLPGLGYRSYFIERITRLRRSVHSDDKFTKVRKKNYESDDSDDNSSNNEVENDKLDDNRNHEVKNRHKKMHLMHSDDYFTKVRKTSHLSNTRVKNDEIGISNGHLSNNGVKNDEFAISDDHSSNKRVNDKQDDNPNHEVKNHHMMMRSIGSDDHFTKLRVENEESSNFNDHLSINGNKNDEIGDSGDHSSSNGVKNEKLEDNHKHEDKNHQKRIMRSFNSKDHFTRDRAKYDDYDNINDHISDVHDKRDQIHDGFSRKIRSIYFKENFIRKNDRFDDINDHFKDDREKKYEYVRLHDVKNFNTKVKQDINIFKEPNVTRIIRLKKNAKQNEALKRIFESINNDEDNFELDIVFGGARENKNDTNKNSTIFDLNESNKDLNTDYRHGNEKHDYDVTEYNLDRIIGHSSKLDHGTIKNDSKYSNKHGKTNIDKEKHVKKKHRNILKGLKRCNCKIGRLKRDKIETNSEELTNDTIDEKFGNKTLRFIHFKKDVEKEQNSTTPFKREIKDNKQIKRLKHEIKNLQRKIKDIIKLKVKDPKEDEIKNLILEIKDLKREILDIYKSKGITNETRPERSLFKKIKNAKKKYLRRQTNYLKIDDESLLNNDHHYDDNEFLDEEEDLENTTEVNERYVFEHVTDYSDYVVTPKSRDEQPSQHLQLHQHVTTEGVTTETTTTTTTTTTTKETTKKPESLISTVYSDTRDSYISNKYINITTDINKNISFIALSNGLVMALNINFYYFASDDPMRLGRPEFKKPGAFVFRPMDPEPVFISRKPKVEVYKSSVVEEIHSNSNFASYIIRLYKNTPYFELQWIVRGIPISDGIGKEVFIRYSTDLETNGVFYTDANGRQTVKRVFGHRPLYTPASPDAIAGNYFPVTSKITLEDPTKLIRFSVFNDRTQGGTSFNGEIDLMLNRRLLTDDAGIQAFMNETENGAGTTISGKHYIYITKLTTKVNKIFEKKLAKEIGLQPQIFLPTKMVDKSEWKNFNNEFFGVKKIPIGLNVLTLQEWNDNTYLIRIENYLEVSDIVKSGIKKIILKDLFTVFRIVKVKETTLAGNIFKEDHVPISWTKTSGNTEAIEFKEVKVDEEILFKPQQIRTFVIWVRFNK